MFVVNASGNNLYSIMNEICVPNANHLAEICLKLFETIPKTGKPTLQMEWTVLSCIAKYQHQSNVIDVVAFGTGKLNFIAITDLMVKCSKQCYFF